jgi:hypothetical protein
MADTIYTYTGNPFAGVGGFAAAPYVSTDFISITFTVTNPLAANLLIDNNSKSSNVTPTSYSSSDGVQTLDNGNSAIGIFNIGTDGSGHIINWHLFLFPFPSPSSQDLIASEDQDQPGEMEDFGDFSNIGSASGIIRNNPGTWTSSATSTSPVPEPSTFTLLGTGILGLAGVARRKLFRA